MEKKRIRGDGMKYKKEKAEGIRERERTAVRHLHSMCPSPGKRLWRRWVPFTRSPFIFFFFFLFFLFAFPTYMCVRTHLPAETRAAASPSAENPTPLPYRLYIIYIYIHSCRGVYHVYRTSIYVRKRYVLLRSISVRDAPAYEKRWEKSQRRFTTVVYV